jgi:glycosyltransferase involved in cell wall biosynthesis
VPLKYRSRIEYIINGIPLPNGSSLKDYSGRIKVLYVGRGTEEKRIHLIAQIAHGIKEQGRNIDFDFMGDVENAIPGNLLPYCNLLGHKTNNTEIELIYRQSHIVIITSYTEGFPMVIMEGMAHNCAVIATPVGDIPLHVKNKENGFLFTEINDEQKIVAEGIEYIGSLNNDRALLEKMGNKNRQYAFDNFGVNKFNESYRQLINHLRSQV